MFSGIVEEVGEILAAEPAGLTVRAQQVLEGTSLGDSIAVDGACLTVTAIGESWFKVDTMPETLRKTALGTLQKGSPVNLERALAAHDRIGGHMVQGHVEAAVQVLSVQQDGISSIVQVSLPEHLRGYVVPKGYVTLNGASLTVVETTSDSFTIALIPFTMEHTNLGKLQVGSVLNLETDILGRYVVQFLKNAEIGTFVK